MMTREIENRLALGLSYWDYAAGVAYAPDGSRRRIPGAYCNWILRNGPEPTNARTLNDDSLADLPLADDDDEDADDGGLLASRSPSASELRKRQAKLGGGFNPTPAPTGARPSRGVAIHEAAHAVVACLNGFNVGNIICDAPQAGKRGGITPGWSVIDLSGGLTSERLAVMLAGDYAERVFGGGGGHNGTDTAEVRELLAQRFGNPDSQAARECLRSANQQATQAVSRHRFEIELIAGALQRNGRVDGSFIRSMVYGR